MSIVHGFAGAIGTTPLIRLDGPSRATGCGILGKAEFMNPGGSVRERAARAIIEDAERSGRLQPGGTHRARGPQGSALYRWVKYGELKAEGPGPISEGIGIGRITANLKDSPIDDAVHIPDTESVATVRRLLREEGLFLGSASGVDVAGALRVAKELGPGHTVVTILCDSGHKHQSRLFNREWLASKGLASGLDA
jgi:cysteine synthase